MTDVATTAPPVAAPVPPPPPPVVAAAPAPVALAPAAAAPPAPPADADPGDGSLPKWVAARLEQAKRVATADTLRAIGAETPEAAKAAVERAKAAADAEKSAADRASEATARAAVLQKERDEYHGTISVYATAQLSSLTTEQRAAVTALAGDNPAAQLRALEALRPTWAVAPPVPVVTPAAAPPAAPPAPLAPPANTAAPTTAPAATPPPAATDHLAVLKTLETTNPIRAARYRTTFAGEIEAATKARGGK